jgi:hypothetical protein
MEQTAGAGAGGGGKDSNGGGGEDSGGGDFGATGDGVPVDGGGTDRVGMPGTTASLPPAPEDVGDGSDDDIVARNLREAAESEPDPQLREKLWEEYRAYKRSIR